MCAFHLETCVALGYSAMRHPAQIKYHQERKQNLKTTQYENI